MKRKDADYQICADIISKHVNQTFNEVRVENDEELQYVVASDIASVAFSKKRAYFNGKYRGAKEDRPDGDIINLESILEVKLKKGIYKYQIYVVLALLGVMAISIGVIIHSFPLLSIGGENPDAAGYAAIRTIIAGIICLIALYWSIASFDYAECQLIQFICKGRKYAIEIRDTDIFEEVHKILLVAKQKSSEIPKIVKSDMKETTKITSLESLLKMYEHGLIDSAEFELLKKEVISNK